MGAITAAGGTVAGGAIGYAVAGRAGAVVGATLGAIGGYNVTELVAVVADVQDRPRAATFRARAATAGDTGARRTTVAAPATVDPATARERLRAIGYDPDATIVDSKNGDPYGSFRVRRSFAWESRAIETQDKITLLPRSLLGVATLGFSELAYQAIREGNVTALRRSIDESPEFAVFSPDYPPAIYPYETILGVTRKVDTGTPFTDFDRARQLELYGPTDEQWRENARAGAYVANVAGKRVIMVSDDRQVGGINV